VCVYSVFVLFCIHVCSGPATGLITRSRSTTNCLQISIVPDNSDGNRTQGLIRKGRKRSVRCDSYITDVFGQGVVVILWYLLVCLSLPFEERHLRGLNSFVLIVAL
jgi:hypothetical protein